VFDGVSVMYLIKIQQRLTHYQFIYGVKTPTGIPGFEPGIRL
jgi:hypothetical protein